MTGARPASGEDRRPGLAPTHDRTEVMDPNTDSEHNDSTKRIPRALATSPLVCPVAGAACVSLASQVLPAPASSGSSANPGNLFSTGAITLTNSKDGTAVINAAGLIPGGTAKGV